MTIVRLYLSFIFLFALFFSGIQVKAVSSDAIAIRVYDNPEHFSALHWYKNQGFVGAPQTVLVDGYEGIRDGNSVYVNAGNVDQLQKNLYTSIYLISYSQDATPQTEDIFGQIIKNFKFNTNLSGSGICAAEVDKACISDDECSGGDYCTSKKAKTVRDVRRLADLYEMRSAMDTYKKIYGGFPLISSGSYIINRTISTWPSWQNILGKALALPMPVDPKNELGGCPGAGYDQKTCWNQQEKKFFSDISDYKLPSQSRVYVYGVNNQGSYAKVCAQIESNYDNVTVENCFEDSRPNLPPVIKDASFIGKPKEKFIGYFSGFDPDGDSVKYSIGLVQPASEAIWKNTYLWDWGAGNNSFVVTSRADNFMAVEALRAGKYQPGDFYQIEVVANDQTGQANGITKKIFPLKISPHAPTLDSVATTTIIGSTFSLYLSGLDSNKNPTTVIFLANSEMNGEQVIAANLPAYGVDFYGNQLRLAVKYTPLQKTGQNRISAYSEDVVSLLRAYGEFSFTLINNPPSLSRFKANYANSTTEECGNVESCSFVIDNLEPATVTAFGIDPDVGHSVNYELVDTFGDKLQINTNSGLISGFEKLNEKSLSDQEYVIGVKIRDQYCANSTSQECSSIGNFKIKVQKYCSISMPESTRSASFPDTQRVDSSGEKIMLGEEIKTCSEVGLSSIDTEYFGQGKNQKIVFVSDLSKSMDANVNGTPAINQLKQALTATTTGAFDKTYSMATELSGEYQVKVGLVDYNSSVRSYNLVDIVASGQLATLKTKVNAYATNFQTNTLEGLNKAEQIVGATAASGTDRIIILMSDGFPGIDKTLQKFVSCYYYKCECGGAWPSCTYPVCGVGEINIGCECCADPGCTPPQYRTGYGCNLSCVAPTCYCGGTYPNCVEYQSGCACGFDYATCKCAPNTCSSAFDFKSKFLRKISSIFETSPVLGVTTQTQCLSINQCSTYAACGAGGAPQCDYNLTTNCSIETDVKTQASALKASGVQLYTIYYNTTGQTDTAQLMCDWSGNNGADCSNLTGYAFAGTNISEMFDRVLSRIVNKPKDVIGGSSQITDDKPTKTSNKVVGSNFDGGLVCGQASRAINYTGAGRLEFSNLKYNYCPAKLH